MRRSTRLGLAAASVLLAVVGAYTAYWFIAANRIEQGLGQWAQSLRSHDLDLSWRAIRVAGFPFAFRLELDDVQLRNHASAVASDVQVPRLNADVSAWNFHTWRLDAPDGLTAASGERDGAKLSARMAKGVIVIAPAGGATLWFGVSEPKAEAGVRLAAQRAFLWLSIPAQPPRSHSERAVGIALDVRSLTLPTVPAPFQNPLDEASFGLTVRGNFPTAPLRDAVAAWRDSGGTLDLDHLALRWGALAITGSGTLSLDAGLQPIGAFSGAIEGYQQLMTALVAAGRIRASNAGLARLALAMISRAGPDGRPQIATSFRIQDGQMYLGSLPIGPAPRIAWQ